MTTNDNRRTTGIGSLPHHNIDAALACSFQTGIPYLPQIPIRNPWEFMIAQALDGLPGIEVSRDGQATLNEDVWISRAADFDRRLTQAFARASRDTFAFEIFEPATAASSSWQAFLWELKERGATKAKVQLAGPLTVQWALRLRDNNPAETLPGLTDHIFRLILARSLAMCRKLVSMGIKPLIYLDEPAIYGLSSSNTKHIVGLQQLRILIQTLRQEGFTVGLHCCSNTDWSSVLGLGLNLLSIDARLSWQPILSPPHRSALQAFLNDGGFFSLGVIPTEKNHHLGSLDIHEIFDELVSPLAAAQEFLPADTSQRILSQAIYTPACGLALHSVQGSHEILGLLHEFYDAYIANLR